MIIPPWEVPQTPQNDFPLRKSLRPLGMSFPLGSPPDPSEWFFQWEVPHTPQNDFSTGKSPRPLRIQEVMPFSTTTPPPFPPLTFKSTFPSYVFLPTWRFSPSSLNYLETSAKLLVVQQGCHLEAGTRDFPRLLRTWPLATFMVK